MRARLNRWHWAAVLLAALVLLAAVGCGGGGSNSSTSFPSTTTITSSGGSVTSGNATVSIPGGAISSPTLVSVQAATTYTADPRIVSSTVFTFNANGATFVQPVTISITYSTANIPTGGVESSLTLFKLVSNVWTQVSNSSVNTTTKVVTGTDTTLGTYAVLATTITSTTTTGSGITVLFTSNRAAAYTTPNLYTVTATGTGLTELTNLLQGQSVSSGFFKPDGTEVVFTEQIAGGSNVELMTASGANVTTLVGGDFRPDGLRTNNHNAEFSPDGTRIVFARDITGEDEVYIMNADGSGITQLTQGSPTGDQITQVSITRAGQISFKLTYNSTTYNYLINTDGTGLTTPAAGSLTLLPWWSYSPSGANIVYVQASGGTYDVYTATSTGTNVTKITSLGATAIDKVRYSHDGTKILFDASISGANPDVYGANPDGTSLVNLTNNAASDRFMDAH